MENVNNLNGVPNFGHGIPEDILTGEVFANGEVEEELTTPAEEPEEEVETISNTEETE